MELLRRTFRRLRAYERDRQALRKLHEELDTCNAHLQLQVPFRQFVEARRRTGCDVDEYFAFEFFKKTPEQQETFLTRARRSEVIEAIGDLDIPSTIPGNKLLFNMIFGEFLARDWINPTRASGAEFVQFIREHGEVMVKPALDYGGKGIETYRYAGDEAALALHSQLLGQGVVVEERMVQHPDMARLNPHCVNSVRVSTYTDCDDVHILFATARSGAGDGPVDNFTSGGMSAAVDWHTGVICADGIDQDYRRIQRHPLDGHGAQGLPDPQLGQGAGRGAPRGAQGLRAAPVPLGGLGPGLPGQRRSRPPGRQLEAGLAFAEYARYRRPPAAHGAVQKALTRPAGFIGRRGTIFHAAFCMQKRPALCASGRSER